MHYNRYTTVMAHLASYLDSDLDDQKVAGARAVLDSFNELGPDNFDEMARINAVQLEYKLASFIPGHIMPKEWPRRPVGWPDSPYYSKVQLGAGGSAR